MGGWCEELNEAKYRILKGKRIVSYAPKVSGRGIFKSFFLLAMSPIL